MLYKKNKSKKLDINLYKNPTSEYRAAPFWSWNCKLDKQELLRQIDIFKDMGFGGFHMHSRSGMATEYLSEEFMDLIKSCRDKAKKNDMLAWLYDEDRWPSGSAGGYLTKEKKHRQKKLLFSENATEFVSREVGIEEGSPYLLAVFDIELDEDGYLKSYKIIGENDKAENIKRYAYVKTVEESGWFNGQTYADTLSDETIKRFIDITYESYKKEVGDSFDKTVPAIFTDEPQFKTKIMLKFAKGKEDAEIPWTTDFNETYKEKYGYDIISKIPEIFYDLLGGEISVSRYNYHNHICERFEKAFFRQCGKWCEENGISLTGHVMCEDSLDGQTMYVGETMRYYKHFGFPGIDMLCNFVELTTAKQCQSVVHQCNKEAMMSELYGVTNWDFDFRGHKFQGDWQAALGVNIRVPHLSWVSMKGSAKRDYPASINYQAPWYKEYKYIEDHFARLNTVLTRGKPIVKVGVIHPIESFWLYFGPGDLGSDIKKSLNKNFFDITEWLIDGMVDYDFINESMLEEIGQSNDNKLCVGSMSYSTILVPGCKTLRRNTFELLKKFVKKGGKLIFAGNCPLYIDAVRSNEIKELYDASIVTNYEKLSILDKLKEEATAIIYGKTGEKVDGYVHTFRQDGETKWFFLAHYKYIRNRNANPTYEPDCARHQDLTIVFKGEYIPKLYNTIDGTIENIDFETINGRTYIYKTVYEQESLLINLTSGSGKFKSEAKEENVKAIIDFKKNVEYSRDEENVLLLDIGKYKVDDGEWQDEEEILKIDKKCREELNYPLADGGHEQPWVIKEEKCGHYITLNFEFESNDSIDDVYIAGEEAEYIKFNGNNIELSPVGYYVDKDILKYKAGNLKKGINTVEIKAPITKRIGLENYFLLGDFDVYVRGCEKKIYKKSEKIGFSDITSQGMPFYGGNIIYKTEIDVPASTLKIRVNRYRGALLKVYIDGKDAGNIVYPPYTLKIENVSKGKHVVEFKVFGNRVNTFGPIHDSSRSKWTGRVAWYTEKYEWSYEYEPKATGIISSPVIEVIK